MKTTNHKTLFAVISALLLSAASLVSSQSPVLAQLMNKKQGKVNNTVRSSPRGERGPVGGKLQDPGANPQKGIVKTDVGKIREARDRVKNPANCPSPRPKDRGCKIPCKPCQIAVCEDGKWKYEKVDWPKAECEPRPLPGGTGANGDVCTIGKTDPCPAECKKCVRQ